MYHRNNPSEIVHFCGYESPTTLNDVKELTLELLSDEEFGEFTPEDLRNDFLLRRADEDEIKWVSDNN